MDKESSMIALPCDFENCMFVVGKNCYEDGDISYLISMQDSRCVNGRSTLWERIKRASKILFGKYVPFNDLYMEGEETFHKLVKDMENLEGLQHIKEGN